MCSNSRLKHHLWTLYFTRKLLICRKHHRTARTQAATTILNKKKLYPLSDSPWFLFIRSLSLSLCLCVCLLPLFLRFFKGLLCEQCQAPSHHASCHSSWNGFSLAELSRVPRREGKQLCFVVELQLPMVTSNHP
jgi:hypothetical protein